MIEERPGLYTVYGSSSIYSPSHVAPPNTPSRWKGLLSWLGFV